MLSHAFVVLILCCASLTEVANAKKVLCSFSDSECLLKSTKAFYPIIIAGRPGEVEASDPLYLDEIVLEVPDLKYVLSKATLYGLHQCTMKELMVNTEKLNFYYYKLCPSLTIESDYEVNGVLDGVPVNGKGANKLSYSKYHVWLNGNYSKHIDKAGDLHTHVVDFTTKLRAEEVTREYTGLYVGEKEPAAEDNISRMEEQIREPLMYNFLKKYVKNLNDFLKVVPFKDISYEIKDD